MKVRGVAQNSAFALAGDLAAKGGTVVLLMIAARGLGTTQFAVVATATAAATVLSTALDLGCQTLLTRDGVHGPAQRKALLRALTLARIPLVLIAAIGAAGLGLALGRVPEALLTVLLATAGAAQLTLTGALRAAQDLRPEAVCKVIAGVVTVAAAAAVLLASPSATAVLAALTAASWLTLAPMAQAVRKVTTRGNGQTHRAAPLAALRKAAPLGAMALATLIYYRSGTIALSLWSQPAQTSVFAAAGTVAWGLLCVGNAVTTGLLPRLAAATEPADRAHTTRRALAAITLLAVALGAGVALLAGPVLEILFGARFDTASGREALAIMAAATILIAPAGVLGTALVAAGKIRALAFQVGASLAVNLATLVLFAPRMGAPGAALATLACETVGLAILAGAAGPQLRPQRDHGRAATEWRPATTAAGAAR
jgi:O-antigen/teichoic acid export membrane protein